MLKSWDKERHRNYYSVEKDFFKNFSAFIVSSLRKERAAYMRTAEQVRPVLEDLLEQTADAEMQEEVRGNLSDMNQAIQFYDWLNRFADLLETGKIFHCLPKQPNGKTD